MNRYIIRVIIAVIFLGLLGSLIIYGRGYRVNTQQQTIESMGIIAVSSQPDGAKIYINDKLKGATNSNIMLSPGEYHVKVIKEGYSSWEKSVSLKGELVLKLHAFLFPLNPSFSPITNIGITRAFSSPSSKTIVIISEKGDEEKDGIYALNIQSNPLSITDPLKPIASLRSLPPNIDIQNTKVVFSPDEKDVLITFPLATNNTVISYVLSLSDTTTSPFNVTQSITSIQTAYETKREEYVSTILSSFKDPFPSIATSSFSIISFSPDNKKVLYESKSKTKLPSIISPSLIAINQTPQQRDIEKGNIYIYDREEDLNYSVPFQENSKTLWTRDGRNIIFVEDNHIEIADYDSTNKRTLYSGPFENDFFALSGNGKLLILANFNPKTNEYPEIYAVDIQ